MLTIITGIKVARHCLFGNGTEQRNKRKFCERERERKTLKTGRVTPPSISRIFITLCHKENRQSSDDTYMNVMYGRELHHWTHLLSPLQSRKKRKQGGGEDDCKRL